MINHLEPIDMAMEKAIEDGMQTQIYQFVELPEEDRILNEVTRSHRVSAALRVHKAYLEQKGGEKTI
jgi:Tfp pilus assembly ATPase PilU